MLGIVFETLPQVGNDSYKPSETLANLIKKSNKKKKKKKGLKKISALIKVPSETESIVRLSVSVPYCQISLFHMNFTSKETGGKKAELLHLLNLIYLDDLYMYFYLCQSDTRHLSLTQQHKTH